MSFYWLNLNSVPINLSAIAFEDTSGSPTSFSDNYNIGYPNELRYWPFSATPSYRKNLKNVSSRKYSNFVWGTQTSPWWGGEGGPKLYLLESNINLFPYPWSSSTPRLNNFLIQNEITREVAKWRVNNTLLNTIGLNAKANPTGGNTSLYTLSHVELGKSVRLRSVYPGQAGNQYEFLGVVGAEIFSWGEPQGIAVYRHQLGDILRPIHYFNQNGIPFDPLTDPLRDNISMYNGNYGFTRQTQSDPAPAYYFNKTIHQGSIANVSPENFITTQNLVPTFRRLRTATKVYPETLSNNGITINTSSVIVDSEFIDSREGANNDFAYFEWFDFTGQTAPHNEQHMSYNLITTFVALTGDYMAEDELDFLATPELLMYRPWNDPTNIAAQGIPRNRVRFPGGGEREFGRKLLAYTQAMRVTKGQTFTKFYLLAKHLCDIVDSVFKIRSNNYSNESLGSLMYSTGGAGDGEGGANGKNRIYSLAASSINSNFRGGAECNLLLPWQMSYAIRGLDAFIKYNYDQKYKDLLIRIGRSLFLFGVFKEKETMPVNRRSSAGDYTTSAPTMWPGYWKTVNYMQILRPVDFQSEGRYFTPLPASSFYEADWMYSKGTDGGVRELTIRPKGSPAVAGIAMPGVPGFQLGDSGAYYSNATFATTVSAGFSAGPDGTGYMVSGVCPTSVGNTAFLTEFNRQVEISNYVNWILPAAQILARVISDSDAARHPRALEARDKAREYINSIFLHPTGLYPSNYKTMLGHNGDYTSAPSVPPRSLRADWDTLTNFAVYGPIP